MDPAQAPIRATTQDHLSIEDIRDDIVILKDGSCCLILQTTAVNFDLLSEAEQDAIIYAYSGLLNSLTFPIQIYIRSQKKDISSYLTLLKNQINNQQSEKFRQLIKNYQEFITKTVKENEVLDKNFYLVLPFSSLELGISQGLRQGLMGGGQKLLFPKEYILEKAKTSLYPKRDHVIKQFARIGLKTVQLTSKQLIELFFLIYSPETVGQRLGLTQDYNNFLVQPALETNRAEPVSTASPPSPQINNGKLSEGQLLNQKIDKMIDSVNRK